MVTIEDDDLLPRVQQAFQRTFGRLLDFQPSLCRAAEPRWTSLKHVEFIVALENEFDVRFDGADATDIVGIASALLILRQKMK